jgi:hypothetical protein
LALTWAHVPRHFAWLNHVGRGSSGRRIVRRSSQLVVVGLGEDHVVAMTQLECEDRATGFCDCVPFQVPEVGKTERNSSLVVGSLELDKLRACTTIVLAVPPGA